MTLVIPMVTWQDAREEWVVDIYSRLLGDRIIFVGTPIDEQIANLVVAELLHLESEQSDSAPAQTLDQRLRRPGALFVCLRGSRHDGHEFIGDAAARGAVAVLCKPGRGAPQPAALEAHDPLVALASHFGSSATTKAGGPVAENESALRVGGPH